MTSGFPEEQLVQNRSPVLLTGGNDGDRRQWAEESAQRLRDDGVLTTVEAEADLPAALVDGRRVIYIPDVGAMSHNAQVLLLKTLLERDDRPKLILGLSIPQMEARLKGKLRDDLSYRLHLTQVDLSTPGLKSQLKDRRAKLERELDRRKAEAERAAREAERQAKALARQRAEAARAQALAARKQEKKSAREAGKPAKSARKAQPKKAIRKAPAKPAKAKKKSRR